MPHFKPMDPAFPIQQQIAIDAGRRPRQRIHAGRRRRSGLFAVWKDDAEFMKRQPGFISTQLHRALGDSPTYLNYAIWESTEAFRAAFTHPEFVAAVGLSVVRRRGRTCFGKSA